MELLKAHWNKAAAAVAWIVSIVGTFFVAPPVSNEEQIGAYAQFVLTILIGLLLIAMAFWDKYSNMFYWIVATLALLVCGIFCFFFDMDLRATHIVDYNGKKIITGNEYTEHAKTYCREEYNLDPKDVNRDDLLEDYAGRIERIWTQSSIDRVRLYLAITYVLTLPVFGGAMMSLIQAIHCSTHRERKEKDKPKSSN